MLSRDFPFSLLSKSILRQLNCKYCHKLSSSIIKQFKFFYPTNNFWTHTLWLSHQCCPLIVCSVLSSYKPRRDQIKIFLEKKRLKSQLLNIELSKAFLKTEFLRNERSKKPFCPIRFWITYFKAIRKDLLFHTLKFACIRLMRLFCMHCPSSYCFKFFR